jgi:MYXO-CTERM domain-containing protein
VIYLAAGSTEGKTAMGSGHSGALALLLIVGLAPRPAVAQCEGGDVVSDDCGFIPGVGCCVDDVLSWCDDGSLCRLDCEVIGALLCGWDANDPAGPRYDCGTGGLSGPGDTPLACDSDGDGYHDEWDCAPEDPTVHPEGTEICDDGIDNDCDEDVDADDSDCPDTDDDTGDDDTGPADDDDGGDDDDGSPPGADLQPGFLCACRVAGAGATSLAALALPGFAALVLRRRRR